MQLLVEVVKLALVIQEELSTTTGDAEVMYFDPYLRNFYCLSAFRATAQLHLFLRHPCPLSILVRVRGVEPPTSFRIQIKSLV